jgi:hypothetical protein
MMVVEVNDEDDLDEESDGEGGFVTRSSGGVGLNGAEEEDEEENYGDSDDDEDEESGPATAEGPQPRPEQGYALSASLAAARASQERPSAGAAAKPSKFDVPTMGEQRALRSAGDLLRSNLLVLQAQALLQEAVALPHEDDVAAANGGLGDDDDEDDDDGNGGGGGSGKRGDPAAMEALRRAAKAQAAEQVALTAWLFGLRSWLLQLPPASISAADACRACPGLPLSSHGRAALAASTSAPAAAAGPGAAAAALEPPPALAFLAPAKVDVVGDFMLRSVRKAAGCGSMAVDVLLTMPDECLG